MADEKNPEELDPIEQANVKEAKDRMANFSPAMLLHMAQWCQHEAKQKALMPQPTLLTFDGLKAGEPRLDVP